MVELGGLRIFSICNSFCDGIHYNFSFGSSLLDDNISTALRSSCEMLKSCSGYVRPSCDIYDFNLSPLAKSFWYGEFLYSSFTEDYFCVDLIFRFLVCSLTKSLINYSASSGSDILSSSKFFS